MNYRIETTTHSELSRREIVEIFLVNYSCGSRWADFQRVLVKAFHSYQRAHACLHSFSSYASLQCSLYMQLSFCTIVKYESISINFRVSIAPYVKAWSLVLQEYR